MATDYCSYLRSHLAEKLAKLGLVEVGCRQFGQHFKGHGAMFAGSVIYYRGHGWLVAIEYSYGDGTSCLIGRDDADPSTYKSWTSLWDLSGMTNDLNEDDPESLDAYLEQFPSHDPDAMLALVAEKLGEVIAA